MNSLLALLRTSNDMPYFSKLPCKSVGPNTIPAGKTPPFGKLWHGSIRMRVHYIEGEEDRVLNQFGIFDLEK